jgi:hypothetical protein
VDVHGILHGVEQQTLLAAVTSPEADAAVTKVTVSPRWNMFDGNENQNAADGPLCSRHDAYFPISPVDEFGEEARTAQKVKVRVLPLQSGSRFSARNRCGTTTGTLQTIAWRRTMEFLEKNLPTG